MTERFNAQGQPIGFPVPGWTPRPLPPHTPMTGRTCRVEPLDVGRHAAELHEANLDDTAGRNWTYLSSGPHVELDAYRAWLTKMTPATILSSTPSSTRAAARPSGWPLISASTRPTA